ncbi:hypothetical protein AKJ09_09837 [Labilithrix luteola]|uniref:HNH endonuclease n=1 Tax=Labilithrix luteola TaxID=1391654 RepID=A0A0K1QBP7_9BACT|nr:hypothetical protein [Labilithrix luteola]AKV03174.1 hypothetical protein AKJ09_09837 [Labilithrix luteola]
MTGDGLRAIPGWPGYFASEDGRIFSTWHRVHVSGLTWRTSPDGPLREVPQFDRRSSRGKPTPYRTVALRPRAAGKARSVNKYVHELIALTFIGPRPEGTEILHGPAGSGVHRASNLRYGTPEENSAERQLCSGEAWYRARGLAVPEHAFADLLARAS